MTDPVEVTVEDDVDEVVVLPPPVDPVGAAQQELAARLVEEAQATGVNLGGPGGLLGELTKRVLELGLEVEMSEHLGYDKHDAAGRNGENSRNGTRTKTVLTDVGPVAIEVPRDREGTFEPKTVKKRQRRLEGVDAMVLSLSAKGLTSGGDLGAPGRGLRHTGLQGDDLEDHRRGARGDERLADPPARCRVSGGVHRRDPRQGP